MANEHDKDLRAVRPVTGKREASTGTTQRLSWLEIAGYSAGDAAANFVFMTMILFQANFYTDVFGISAGAAATILLCTRLWDAVADPIVGVLADRTQTRWGKFRPWILFTAVPWCIAVVLAYTTPRGLSSGALMLYAACTNVLLMCIYSMNNMPYAALGGVITGDAHQRARLNSFRFVTVNAVQLAVGALTLPLVAKFSVGHTPQYGWQVTMAIWGVLCCVLFLITFATTKERIQPPALQDGSVWLDLRALLKNGPWTVMFLLTICHFCVLSFRGGALYNYYHHYVDKAAMFDWLEGIGLTAPAHGGATGILEALGYVVHGDRAHLAGSNVADVFNSIVNAVQTIVSLFILTLSPSLALRFGKKAVAVGGFGLAGIGTCAFYLLGPTDIDGMLLLTIVVAVCYGPTIPLIWTMYADVADYSEWQTGRRFTGIAFATICFALKTGLSLGSSAFLWVMTLCFSYDARFPDAVLAVSGFRVCSGLVVGMLFFVCTGLLLVYKLNSRVAVQMEQELAERRKHPSQVGAVC